MNRFLEMIQKGEDLIARTNELLNNEIDLATSGSVDIATYLQILMLLILQSNIEKEWKMMSTWIT